MRAYSRAATHDAPQPSQVSSGIEVIDGKKYVTLRYGSGVLAIYRVRNDGVLKRLNTYVDFRMHEWRMGEQSHRLQTCVRKALRELCPEALLFLKDPRFEVMVLPEADFSVWAYFPVHRGRLLAQKFKPKPRTRVLLVFSAADFEKEPEKQFKVHLRDHLGHVLLYLRDPKARNTCADAQREWRKFVQKPSRESSL